MFICFSIHRLIETGEDLRGWELCNDRLTGLCSCGPMLELKGVTWLIKVRPWAGCSAHACVDDVELDAASTFSRRAPLLPLLFSILGVVLEII